MENNNKKMEEQRFEFLLRINGNIICQRYFHIKGFNEESLGSFELHNMAHDCVNVLKDDLKEKSIDYLWRYFDPYKLQTEDEINKKGIYDKNDNFELEVKIDKKMVIKRGFSGCPYPPKVRYQVDIKDIVYDIISKIRYYLTLKDYTYTFNESEVVIHF